MPPVLSTIQVRDSGGTIRNVRAIEESGDGVTGPFRTGFTWLDGQGVPNTARIDYDGAVAVKSPLVEVSANFQRPANTAQYAVGALVANNTVAGSVAPMAFPGCARADQPGCRSFYIRKARLFKSSPSIVNAEFRLHLFRSLPTVINGDGGALSTARSGYAGAFDFVCDRVFTDGCQGNGVPIVGNEVGVALATGTTIWGLLEARAQYTPISQETFTVELMPFQV